MSSSDDDTEDVNLASIGKDNLSCDFLRLVHCAPSSVMAGLLTSLSKHFTADGELTSLSFLCQVP